MDRTGTCREEFMATTLVDDQGSAASHSSMNAGDEQPAAWCSPPDFSALNRYGWSWCADETVDANYLDLAYLIARNSSCKDGHMGCVIVSGVASGRGSEVSTTQQGQVDLCTINSSLFGAYRSDCHAEANAVAESAARGVALKGLSCYVTRAPCVNCYKLLVSAGIRRIVSPQALDSGDCIASASALGVECSAVRDSDERARRREELGNRHEDMDRVRALREERKRLRKTGAFGKKTIQWRAPSDPGVGSSDLGEQERSGNSGCLASPS